MGKGTCAFLTEATWGDSLRLNFYPDVSVRRPRYNFDPLSQLSWYEFDHVTVKHPIPIRPDKTEMIGRSVLTFSGGCGVIVSEDVCANAPGPCYLVRLESGKYLPCYHRNVLFLDKLTAA